MVALSVNINKVATLRNRAAARCQASCARSRGVAAGAPGITVHPRADERHIRRTDVTDIAAWLAAHRGAAAVPSSSTSRAIHGRT